MLTTQLYRLGAHTSNLRSMSSTIARTAIPITHYRILTKEQLAATARLVAKRSSGCYAGGPLLRRRCDRAEVMWAGDSFREKHLSGRGVCHGCRSAIATVPPVCWTSIPSKHDHVLRRHGRYRRSPATSITGLSLAQRKRGHLIAAGTRAAPNSSHSVASGQRSEAPEPAPFVEWRHFCSALAHGTVSEQAGRPRRPACHRCRICGAGVVDENS